MKRLAFLLCLLSVTAAFAADKVTHVTAEDAAKLVQTGKVTVLDVRTPDEYNEGHIKGAKNVDFSSPDFAAKLNDLDKSKPILVHCQAGGRSTKSLPALEKLGVPIYHLDGGMDAWTQAGKPVSK
ncbi:MAG TPA: rhodanese-like domain-containing protein [Prosthecobacter sp.]|nr:rhodanese-like domain-containing protein [Prosthecobacter sp.]